MSVFGLAVGNIRPFFLFLLVALASTCLLWPGLFGTFLLDDNFNLKGLASLKRGSGLYDWLSFIGEGRSGPGGRPISLLTFAFQHNSWPSLPSDFKVFNLLLHLINGLLLHRLVVHVGRLALWSESSTRFIAVLAPMIWLLHPIQVSTVFYIIQRMTLLSATFLLAGMLVYLKGREWMTEDSASAALQNRGLFLSGIGMVVGGGLAILSKENGALLPFFILITETTLLVQRPWPERLKKWRALAIHGPWILMLGCIALWWDLLLSMYSSRNFSMKERLFTEARVVTEYLRQIFVPRLDGFGLFHDDIIVSHGLTQPITTLWSLLFLFFLGLAALLLRHRVSWFAFGVLWFFVGHLLESTILPLELYFEHRNYLAVFGTAFIVSWSLLSLYRFTENRRTRLLTIIFGVTLLGHLAFVSREESVLWGDSFQQAIVWGEEKPNSIRALLYLGNMLYSANLIDSTQELLDKYEEMNPDDPTALLVKLKLVCHHPDQGITMDDDFIRELTGRHGGNRATITSVLESIIEVMEQEKCKGIEPGKFAQVLLGLLENSAYGGPITRSSLHLLAGRTYAVMGNLNATMEHFDLSQTYDLRVDTYLQQVKWLASAGLIDDARIYLKKAENLHKSNWLRKVFQKNKLEPYYQMIESKETANQSHSNGANKTVKE